LSRYIRSLLVMSVVALGCFSSIGHAASATPSNSSLERFIDGIMQHAIVTGATQGATVSVVQNGRLIVARGYGLADVEQKVPVESRVTQFRIGSISKVLVWMSVLQLVEAGKLDLDADVNTYLLEFKVREKFSDPITLRHLMTHTPGFEDNLQNLFVSGPRQVGTLVQTLAALNPDRVTLPGSTAAYSNYGAALAGRIVEIASGMSWNDYVEAHIFKPLNMRGATSRQPVAKEIEDTRSKGYVLVADQVQEQPFMYIVLAPAGSVTATALDMARLMVELLNPRGTSVLSDTSKGQLVSGAYISDPQVNGITLGMYEMSQGGTRAVGHRGSTLLFDSLMVLWPDEKMGLFVSTNTLGGQNVARELFTTLSNYLGFTQLNAELTDVTNPEAFVGDYISARRNFSGVTKLMGLTGVVQVGYDQQALALTLSGNAGTKLYRKLSDNIFQQVSGANRIGFKVSGGHATEMFSADQPVVSYQPASRIETPAFALVLYGVWAMLAAGALVVWPFSWLTNRRNVGVGGSVLLTTAVLGSIGLLLAFVAQAAAAAASPVELLLDGIGEIESLLWYVVGFAVLVFVQILYFFPVWVSGYWWLSRRLHYTALMAVNCVLLWWLWYWNLFPAVLLNVFA